MPLSWVYLRAQSAHADAVSIKTSNIRRRDITDVATTPTLEAYRAARDEILVAVGTITKASR